MSVQGKILIFPSLGRYHFMFHHPYDGSFKKKGHYQILDSGLVLIYAYYFF